MQNIKYRVSRDNVYVGEVAKVDEIFRYSEDRHFYNTKAGQLDLSSWVSYRSMLFVPDEKKLSNDLLYRSPSYPILNVTDDEICLALKEGSIVIKDACNLAPLLEYFGYDKDLTYEDIMTIRKTFFTGRFAKDNCELFGYEEHQPEDWTYYQNGVEITNPKKLKKRIEEEKRLQKKGHRSFGSIPEYVLPQEYFDILDDRGDNTLKNAILWHDKINAFAPHIQEGIVKKLTKF